MRLLLLSVACVVCAAVSTLLPAPTGAQDPAPNIARVLEDRAVGNADLPEPRKHEWLENIEMEDALKLAAKEKRPLFVTIRCLPCKQCSWWDNALMKPSTEMQAKLSNFICVRIVSMRDMDARLFRFEEYQDLDCSWWGYFFDPDGRIYSVYGGIDITGDKARMSEKGLMAAMDGVLSHHYHPKRSEWAIDGPAPELKGKPDTPLKHKGWKSWARHAERADKIAKDKTECLHCHECAEVVRQPRFDKKDFDKQKDFYVWPYPENIGLELELDSSLLVKKVLPDSAAAKAGIKAGDMLQAAGDRLVFSTTDLRGVLHRLPFGDAELTLWFSNKDGVQSVELALVGEWRKYNPGWRKSVAEADIGAHHGFPWPLACNDSDRQKAGVAKDVMCVKPYFPKGPVGNAGKAGLKAGDYVIAVDGESPNIAGREFCAWFRMRYEPGDKVKYTVADSNGKQREIEVKVGRHSDD